MSNIAIIDADLISNGNHRFPNLASMKISAWEKSNGNNVILKTDYDNLEEFKTVYISKVFTNTFVPEHVLSLSNVKYGGTGFYYDEAPPLLYEIEHHMPDYDLYLEWVNEKIKSGEKEKDFRYYTDYSIGFTTRGCFRKCKFCVNKKYDKVVKHSPVSEFLHPKRKKICLLDDNILGYGEWREVFNELNDTKRPFQYKQGMDIRTMTPEKAKILAKSKYDSDFIFAFDNISDIKLINKTLGIWRENCGKRTRFYVLTAFDENEKYDNEFWLNDIINTFKRIELLQKYDCIPYIMRYEKYKESPHKDIYTNLASWCNQVSIYKKFSFYDYCVQHGMNQFVYKEYKNDYEKYLQDGYKKGSSWRAVEKFEENYPMTFSKYFLQKHENNVVFKEWGNRQ